MYDLKYMCNQFLMYTCSLCIYVNLKKRLVKTVIKAQVDGE